jgi:diguanylate cyclase (GGDEF)-like protein
MIILNIFWILLSIILGLIIARDIIRSLIFYKETSFMNYKAKIWIHFSMLIYVLIYFIATVYESTFWGDILSPVGTTIAFAILFYVSKKSTRMSLAWLFLSIGALSWTIIDIAWATCELVLGQNPDKMVIFNVMYLIPNIFILTSVMTFFKKIIKRLNRIQLLLDILAISLSCITIFWILLMHSSVNMFIESIDNIILFLCMVIDFIIISSGIFFFLSTRKGKIPSGIYLTFFGEIFFAIIDILYFYAYFYGSYVPNSIIDSGYTLSFLLLAHGGLVVIKKSNTHKRNRFYLEFENSGKDKKGFILLIFPVILIIFEGFQYSELIFLISIYVFYQGLSNYVQNAMENEKLLVKEKNMNLILEEKINERTKELLLKNKELEYISNHDFTTNVYNGRYLKNALDNMLKAESNCDKITVLYIDFNRFKAINDTYGHDVGDEVLIEISKRLTMTNNKDNILARLGGDEFALVIAGNYSREEIENIIIDMIHLCNEPIYIGNYQFRVTISIGITMFPEDGNTRNILMKNADIAMYNSKSKGYNQYSFFNSFMNDIILEKHEIEMLLRNADYNKEFQLHYQPQINIKDEKLVGVEALIRWNSSVKGNIRPDKFIKIAEEIGCIEEISDWVINEAARQISEWNIKYRTNLKMGINISPKQLDGINFVNKLKDIIDIYKLQPEWLDIEITENIAMRGEITLGEIFASLDDLSISTSIDDFGTGYSSLSYIQEFSFNRLKIAKELIDKISTDSSNNHIVEAIVMMSKSLSVTTIAEGVETYEQLEILKDIGCDEIQGYIFSKPLPAKEFEASFLNEKLVSQLPCMMT